MISVTHLLCRSVPTFATVVATRIILPLESDLTAKSNLTLKAEEIIRDVTLFLFRECNLQTKV